VLLQYSTDNFGSVNTTYTINSSANNTNFYNWTLPNLGETGLPHAVFVRITDVNDSSVNYTTDYFNLDLYSIRWT